MGGGREKELKNLDAREGKGGGWRGRGGETDDWERRG